MSAALPILYSFRRCPYAIRARMTLNYAGIGLEHREVLLSDKPKAMLEVSAKGTVPILELADGSIIDESIDVMHWALKQQDTDHWWQVEYETPTLSLVEENDFVFKQHLDHYKYADRYPKHSQLHYRTKAEKFLMQLEEQLMAQHYLLNNKVAFADIAIFPFMRQFAFVDKPWFDQAPYPNLQIWLQWFLDSELFSSAMTKYPVWHESHSAIYIN